MVRGGGGAGAADSGARPFATRARAGLSVPSAAPPGQLLCLAHSRQPPAVQAGKSTHLCDPLRCAVRGWPVVPASSTSACRCAVAAEVGSLRGKEWRVGTSHGHGRTTPIQLLDPPRSRSLSAYLACSRPPGAMLPTTWKWPRPRASCPRARATCRASGIPPRPVVDSLQTR